MFKRFLRSTSGNFAMTLALASPAVLFAVGFAIDVTNMMSAKSDLQASLDAAVMAASRIGATDVSRTDTFDRFFASNVAGKNLLRDPTATITVNETLVDIRNVATAQSHVDLNFMPFFKVDPLIKVTAVAFESRKNVEVALVLDNTGSMGEARMKSLRDAASSLVDTLKGMQGSGVSGRKVRAALVPFVTAVNIKGENYKEDWIDKNGGNSLNGVHFDPVDGKRPDQLAMFNRLNVEWKGCVEARPAPYNLDDTAPDKTKPETLFVPYFAPDEPGDKTAPGNDASAFNNSYLADAAPKTNKPNSEDLAKQVKEQRNAAKYNGTTLKNIVATPPLTNGPNRACATPIAPLTEDLDSLKTQIGKMTYWNGSGTNVSEGLAWGWRVLSPGEPYTQGQPFDDVHVSKWVVVFTDGTNEVFGANDTTLNKSDYGSYGFLADNRMLTTDKGRAVTQVNTWTSTMCTELKKQNVQIFTILLGADSAANRKLYGDCASKPEYYFGTNDPTKLKAIFGNIASIIAKLQFTG
ncbi:pilus assembly protein [Mesorhizobium sp. LHD-90]|uniref:pilus assembly protein n=1 Tax=Mesorhizobium sp. LHD-90 TaxID=3071414 RepID=UPI0027DFBE8B|nr:pilus assembly protein [Mesorhizobium sp. LHD-90]MDQ6435100.1 pilus assembly protein [Mesorhizobium sp. LHD-90]